MAVLPSCNANPEGKNPQWFRSLFINALLLYVLTLFCFHQNAFAQTRYSSLSSSFNNNYSTQSPVNFSLSFSASDIGMESNNDSYPISQTRVSAIVENNITANLNIGLIIGPSFISLNNDPATAGFSLSGSHMGFSVNQLFGKDFQMGLHAYYLYQQAKGENTLRTASLTWHEWLVEATLRLRLGTHWAIIAGGGFMAIDIDRKINGDINETVKLELANGLQGKLAIELLTAPDDRIRLTVNRGAADSFGLSFAHTF